MSAEIARVGPHPGTLLGAGPGSWSPLAFDRALAPIRGLDYLDTHLYPTNAQAIANIDALAQIAHARRKLLVMEEAWLYKALGPDPLAPLGETNLQAHVLSYYSFFAPLDQEFLSKLVALTRADWLLLRLAVRRVQLPRLPRLHPGDGLHVVPRAHARLRRGRCRPGARRRQPQRDRRGLRAPGRLSPALRDEHERAAGLTRAELRERLVRALERERLDLRPDGHPSREREELLAVAAGQVRDRAQRPLAPEDLVRERRDVRHVDSRADDGAAPRDRAQRRRAGGEILL